MTHSNHAFAIPYIQKIVFMQTYSSTINTIKHQSNRYTNGVVHLCLETSVVGTFFKFFQKIHSIHSSSQCFESKTRSIIRTTVLMVDPILDLKYWHEEWIMGMFRKTLKGVGLISYLYGSEHRSSYGRNLYASTLYNSKHWHWYLYILHEYGDDHYQFMINSRVKTKPQNDTFISINLWQRNIEHELKINMHTLRTGHLCDMVVSLSVLIYDKREYGSWTQYQYAPLMSRSHL